MFGKDEEDWRRASPFRGTSTTTKRSVVTEPERAVPLRASPVTLADAVYRQPHDKVAENRSCTTVTLAKPTHDSIGSENLRTVVQPEIVALHGGSCWSVRCGEQFSIMAFAQMTCGESLRGRSMSWSSTLEIMRHVWLREGVHVRYWPTDEVVAERQIRLSDLFNFVEQCTLHARLAIVNKASRRPGGRSSQYAPGSRQDRLLAGASSAR